MPILLLFILILPVFAVDSDFQEIDPKREEFLAKKQRAFEVVRGAQEKWDQKMREEKLAKEKLEQEKKLEAEKIVQEKKIEEERIAREKKIEEEKIARENKAREEKVAKENEEQRKKKAEQDRLAKFNEEAKRGWEELLKKKAEANKASATSNSAGSGPNSSGTYKSGIGNGSGNGAENRLRAGTGMGNGNGNGNGIAMKKGGLNSKNCSWHDVDTSACDKNEINGKKRGRFEMYSPDGIVDTGVFSVRFHDDESSCSSGLTTCLVNFCQNPNLPSFCEFDGKIIAEQNMGPYKSADGYKKKKNKPRPSVVQVYKCTDEITDDKLYEVYSVYTFDAPDVFKSHFGAKTGSCKDALTNCFQNMELNPQRPIFCEWNGTIIAEQHMESFARPYKKESPNSPVLH